MRLQTVDEVIGPEHGKAPVPRATTAQIGSGESRSDQRPICRSPGPDRIGAAPSTLSMIATRRQIVETIIASRTVSKGEARAMLRATLAQADRYTRPSIQRERR